MYLHSKDAVYDGCNIKAAVYVIGLVHIMYMFKHNCHPTAAAWGLGLGVHKKNS